jgi:hypothetical protein
MALPKTFTGGERLFASDLNDNFEDLDNAKVASSDVESIVVLTQDAYDALTPNATTLYVVVG